MAIQANLTTLSNQIQACEMQYHRMPGSVSLLAVSKKQSIEKIQIAIASGQRAFGENYLQEALEKITFFKDAALEWHFIGPIQSNKTKKIAEVFQWVHSVDSEKIARRLNDQRPEALAPLNICIQVNISGEQTKFGIESADLFSLSEYCLHLPRLHLRGLMVLPELSTSFEVQRAQFHQAAELLNQLRKKGFMLDTLSMGTSEDFEAAIAEGSTIVRIGSAIFGPRI